MTTKESTIASIVCVVLVVALLAIVVSERGKEKQLAVDRVRTDSIALDRERQAKFASDSMQNGRDSIEAAITPAQRAARRRQQTQDSIKAARYLEQEDANNRVAYAQTLENKLLETGSDFYVTTSGSKKDRLTIRWILVSRPFVHNTISQEFLNNLQLMGFRRLTVTDWV